jgi:hypothetical protein
MGRHFGEKGMFAETFARQFSLDCWARPERQSPHGAASAGAEILARPDLPVAMTLVAAFCGVTRGDN